MPMPSPLVTATGLDALENIRAAVSFDEVKFASLLQLTQENYRKLLSTRKMPPTAAVERLADQLDLSTEAVLSGDIDYKTLSARFSGCSTAIPEKYSFASYSKRRTSIHLLDCIEKKLGWRARSQVLKRLQLNEAIFLDPDAPINIQCVTDICNEIQSRFPFSDVLFEMGTNSVNANFHSKLGNIYRSLEGPKQIYEATFPELAKIYYDTNTHYRLMELSDTHCVLEASPNPLLLDVLKSKTIGSRGTCEQKRGVIASYPAYQYLPHAKVVETQCIHRGDKHCLFYVDFGF